MKTFLQMEMYYVREYFKNLRLESGADPGFGIKGGVSRRGIWGPLKVPNGSRAEPL